MPPDANREISRLSTPYTGVFPINSARGIGQYPEMDSNQALIARLKLVIKTTGIAASRASDRAGLGIDYLRDLFRGKKQSVTSDAIAKLAAVFGCDVEWLATGAGEMAIDDGEQPVATDEPHHQSEIDLSPESNDTRKIFVEYGGVTEAGVFRAVDMVSQEPHRWTHLPRDPNYPRCRQYAFKVHGDSMNDAKIEHGMWVIGIDYDDYLEWHGEVRDGRRVVAERTRFQGAERELTIKEVRLYRDRMELVPRSKRAGYDSLIVPFNQDPDLDITVRILAIVTKSVWDLEEPAE